MWFTVIHDFQPHISVNFSIYDAIHSYALFLATHKCEFLDLWCDSQSYTIFRRNSLFTRFSVYTILCLRSAFGNLTQHISENPLYNAGVPHSRQRLPIPPVTVSFQIWGRITHLKFRGWFKFMPYIPRRCRMFWMNQNVWLESRKTSKWHKIRGESGAFYLSVGHKASHISFQLHFLSNGSSEWEKTVVASDCFDGKRFKFASSSKSQIPYYSLFHSICPFFGFFLCKLWRIFFTQLKKSFCKQRAY